MDAEVTTPAPWPRAEPGPSPEFVSAAPRASVLACLLIFVAGLAATMSAPDKYHGDEMFYTDAAMRMCQSGDYWTPYWANGAIRLQKPILTYWSIAGSFHLFGVNMFASRVPALLAGAGLLALTFLTARAVFRSPRIGLFAMSIVASNLEIMRMATRATPDALLCLFAALSMYGFARIWFQDDKSLWGPMLAFGGMGLAVQTKGLLGLTPLLANGLFLIAARPGSSRLKVLWRPAPVLIGLVLGAFWYAIMVHRHGAGALRDFFDDQVSAKVSSSPLFLLSNPFVYLAAVLQYFPVWIFILAGCAAANPGQARQFWQEHRRQCLFLLSLLAVAIISFSFGNVRRARYLTVAYPMLACLLAGSLSSLAAGRGIQLWIARTCYAGGLLLALFGVVLIVGAFWVTPGLILAGAALLGLGLGGVWVARSEVMLWRWSWISAVFLGGFVVNGASFRPILSPSPLPNLTRELLTLNVSTVYAYGTPSRTSGIVRLLSGGKLQVQTVTSNQLQELKMAPSPVATPSPQLLSSANYTLRKVEPDTPLSPQTKLGQRARRKAYWIGVKIPDSGEDN